MNKCKIITLSNQKGGVGKTTTTYTLALGLVKHGYKVLGVDLDPQKHLTRISNIDNADNTICNCFRQECMTQEAICKTDFGFSLLPGDLNLAGADYEFHDINREFILRNILKQVKDNYDYIVIDTPPNLGVLTINALVASNEVIIPVESGELALEGFEQFFKTYRAAKKYHNPDLKIAGILINMYRRNVNLQREYKKVLEEGCEKLGIHLFESTIRLAADVENMRNERKNILQSKSEVSKDYNQFIEEYLNLDK